MPNQKSTTDLLQHLRQLMLSKQHVDKVLNAYIVPSTDAHNSEYLAAHNKRRAFISGFTGSAGTAVITQEHACVWTDGRYFLQAAEEMDTNWTLMKEGVPSTPSLGTWLSKNLPECSYVGVDPKLINFSTWVLLHKQLEESGHTLIPVKTNLIDLVWENQPPLTRNPIMPLGLNFSGKSISQKFREVHTQMKEKNAGLLVLTSLDEVAWFLNLRGSDIQYNPVFFSFVVIFQDRFFCFIDPMQLTSEVEEHLKSEAANVSFTVAPYDKIRHVLCEAVETTKGRVWMSDTANYALASVVSPKRLKTEVTPIALLKAVKNLTEIKGMRNAHIKDAVALCCYFSWLEKAIKSQEVTEISGAEKLEEFRKQQADFIGPSFKTISAVGSHGAIIHYKPDKSSDVPINEKSLYLCDSGGQYRDGTTDVTRTFHFGFPTDFEKECYTRVLKGQLKLARSIFPYKITGNYIDPFARQYLWNVGLDYAHGTGHGIGSYLNVHEGPMGITWRYLPNDPGLEAGMFLSNEPGYYENGKFGIRLEDIVQVIPINLPHNFSNRGFLTFDTITLVPKQTKLIDFHLLTNSEIDQLNNYHKKCRDIIGPLLEKQGHAEAKKWLWKETEPITNNQESQVN